MVLKCGAVPRAFSRPGLFGYNRAARPSVSKCAFILRMLWLSVLCLGRFIDPDYLVIVAQLVIPVKVGNVAIANYFDQHCALIFQSQCLTKGCMFSLEAVKKITSLSTYCFICESFWNSVLRLGRFIDPGYFGYNRAARDPFETIRDFI